MEQLKKRHNSEARRRKKRTARKDIQKYGVNMAGKGQYWEVNPEPTTKVKGVYTPLVHSLTACAGPSS